MLSPEETRKSKFDNLPYNLKCLAFPLLNLCIFALTISVLQRTSITSFTLMYFCFNFLLYSAIPRGKVLTFRQKILSLISKEDIKSVSAQAALSVLAILSLAKGAELSGLLRTILISTIYYFELFPNKKQTKFAVLPSKSYSAQRFDATCLALYSISFVLLCFDSDEKISFLSVALGNSLLIFSFIINKYVARLQRYFADGLAAKSSQGIEMQQRVYFLSVILFTPLWMIFPSETSKISLHSIFSFLLLSFTAFGSAILSRKQLQNISKSYNFSLPLTFVLAYIYTYLTSNYQSLPIMNSPQLLISLFLLTFSLNKNSFQTDKKTDSQAAKSILTNRLLFSNKKNLTVEIEWVKSLIEFALKSEETKKLFVFLVINFLYMLVEVLVGIFTNSIGLISDAGHMLFDCTALVISLIASFIAKRKPDQSFSYGYERVEVLAGFINAIFLVFVAFFIVTESLERISEPPELETGGLLWTSIGGLLVNLVGVIFFHEHAHGHSHSSQESCHGHSHGSSENMQGVYLHIFADLLGSVGVVISSVLIENYSLYVSDPICSLMISGLIFVSVLPLLKSTGSTLLLRTPDQHLERLNGAVHEIETLEEIQFVADFHLWLHAKEKFVLTLKVAPSSNNFEAFNLREKVKNILNLEFSGLSVDTIIDFIPQDSNRGNRIFSFNKRTEKLHSCHSHGHNGHSHDHHGHSHGKAQKQTWV
eukprot:maker-scaffold_22-snap-gene-3.52-mRNA-1 protein AED:0.00 eAED:0.00 QI:129/1/1/1/1/1/2/84/706